MNLQDRSQEIARHLGVNVHDVLLRLEQGFHFNHALVAEDFRYANPKNDEELLQWYKDTDAYIYELSAYHLDEGFNYAGMCRGIVDRLVGLDKQRVLVLGDGIGDLSMALARAGLDVSYNDLAGSKTAGFAIYRFGQADLDITPKLTTSWKPRFKENSYDAIIALDFFEHLTEVEYWVRQCFKALTPGGQFMAQNAFAIGDDEHGGSIPMHLTRNNKYEFEWLPLLEEVGFTHEINEWWKE